MFGYAPMRIDQICKIARGKVISKKDIEAHPGNYPVYSSQTENNGELGKIDSYMYDGEYLTWTTDGANAGTVFLRDGKFNITNVCGLLQPDTTKVDIHYLFHALSVTARSYVSAGMGNAKLMSNVMGSIVIALPPIRKQKEISKKLDDFERICNDLSSGLPAEISARQKQYEYYRDQLLTFREKQA
ncbi:restriction endonuclease subunit S [Christensenella timonensis]|uniref:restriction endonuclease subunit S n=1 Tax=Christensenella timonensis TaxID=1816678 RepID=UPI001FA76956|nr:restriction endonuclease subunit S [Christensenella timonensis]